MGQYDAASSARRRASRAAARSSRALGATGRGVGVGVEARRSRARSAESCNSQALHLETYRRRLRRVASRRASSLLPLHVGQLRGQVPRRVVEERQLGQRRTEKSIIEPVGPYLPGISEHADILLVRALSGIPQRRDDRAAQRTLLRSRALKYRCSFSSSGGDAAAAVSAAAVGASAVTGRGEGCRAAAAAAARRGRRVSTRGIGASAAADDKNAWTQPRALQRIKDQPLTSHHDEITDANSGEQRAQTDHLRIRVRRLGGAQSAQFHNALNE
ncbi:hypothetical protein PRIPAC_92455 [Pristionchus pacificus]|uniref:Uncharacterized protein n=1 Tax=Pristionchus pacificus TaxID=54126 RepID=A0A2A6BAI6_PRIPA|nr:hypothetical protein PRIPAC_92455 [Pristionchus pacificus]|eukprot:PDM62877.1 hypothetical protein PRIPAC_50092 [Pristionchus pacificus]